MQAAVKLQYLNMLLTWTKLLLQLHTNSSQTSTVLALSVSHCLNLNIVQKLATLLFYVF